MPDSEQSQFILVQGVAPFGVDGLQGVVQTMFRLNTKTGKVEYLGLTRDASRGLTYYQWKPIYEPQKP